MPTPDGRNPAAVVPDRKIGPYLLDVTHKDGGDHAQFFLSRGFRVDDPLPFIRALLEHPTPDRFATIKQTIYVTKYVYEGPMPMPDGSSPRVRSVWKLVDDGLFMALVTAYPI